MKTNSLLILSLTLLFACSKKDDTTTTSNSNGKKGACFSTNTTDGTWNGNIVKLKANWFYTWGTDAPLNVAPQNTEFVTMFWGAGNVTDANITYVNNLKSQGKVKYILGFNEPDLADQSNMTVAKALELWPKLESIGLPLGSPAAAWPTQKWIYDFLDSCIVRNYRVDFICVHMYVGLDDVHFVSVLSDLYNKYHKPIWITEFATVDNNATTVAGNMYTPEQVLGFMQRLLPKLDSLPYVQRYSWFSSSPTSARLWPSSLIDASGNLTTLGKWYADHEPNNSIKAAQ